MRDTAGLLLGLRASMTEGFNLQSTNSIYTFSPLSWALGINYGIVGPLSLGMETLITECLGS